MRKERVRKERVCKERVRKERARKERVREEGVRKERVHKRELSDYTPQGREKIYKNNFKVSLPRCRAVRSWVEAGSFVVEVCSFVV